MRIYTFVVLCALLVSSCSLLDEKEECIPVDGELSSDNLDIPTAFFRTETKFTLNYTLGDCDTPPSSWTVPGKENAQEGIFQFSGQITYGGRFTTGGEVCVQIGEGANVSNTVCKTLEVITNDVWSHGTTATFPGQATNRTITLALGNYVYAGFGEANEWYRFNVNSWEWEERNAVGLSTFEAYTGFTLNGKTYIFGQNSFLYEYNETSDSWTSIAEFPEHLQTTFELEQQSNINNAAQISVSFCRRRHQQQSLYWSGRLR